MLRGHPSNFKVIQVENQRFESNLSSITGPIAAIKSLRFALFCTDQVVARCFMYFASAWAMIKR